MLRVWSTSGQEFPVHTEKLQDVAGLKLRLRAEYGFLGLCLGGFFVILLPLLFLLS